MDAIEDGIEIKVLEQTPVFEHLVDGGPAGGAHGQIEKAVFVEGDDVFAGAEAFNTSAKSPGNVRPAEGVDAVRETSGGAARKLFTTADARVVGG